MILGYLADNPDAKDTVEGIVEWWLLDQEIKCRTAEVKKALADLVSEGFIVERTGTDLRTRYEVNRDRLDEIRNQLETN